MLTDKSPPEELQKRIAEECHQCVYCPVSPPDGTVRPGQMSDCFFDLFATAICVLTWAKAPSAEPILLAKEIIVASFVENLLRLPGLCIRPFLNVKFTF